MVVALAIFALIAAAGTGLLAFSVRAQAAAGGRLEASAALRRVDALLVADLAQATTRATRDRAGTVSTAFVGTSGAGDTTALGLVRAGWANPDGKPRASLQKVAWRRDGDRLVRQVWPMLDGAAPGEPSVMLTGVSGFALRYRYDDGIWYDRWETARPTALPKLVEATITLGDKPPIRAVYLVGTGA